MIAKANVAANRCVLVTVMLLLSCGLFAQRSITGRIINDADNQPIAGASVQVKGSRTATQTNAAGRFTLAVPGDNSILVITMIGFNPEEISVNGRTEMPDLRLKIVNSSLNEVVITGYTAERKKDIIGAVAIVDVKNMKAVPAGNPDQLLQGQASGVQVISSGMPGAAVQVNIRGITSFGNNTPLYVIDGVQADLHDINPADIESIQVLKDAGSAAIYGVQGSNGVVIVTTKKGRPGKMTLTYDGYYGTQRPLSGNPFHLLNSPELLNLTREVDQRDTLTSVLYGPNFVMPDYFYGAGANFGGAAGQYVAQAGDPAVAPSKYVFDAADPDNDYLIAKANKTGTDWFHQSFKPAVLESHTITGSGGSDRSSFLFSLNYFNQQGTLLNTYLKRYSARVNTVFNVKKNVRFGENLYAFFKQNPQIPGGGQSEGNTIGAIYSEQPIIPVYDIMGNYAGTFNGPDLGSVHNPVSDLQRTAHNQNNAWDLIGNAYGEVDFLKHFTVRSSFGGTIDNESATNFTYNLYNELESHTSLNSLTVTSQYNNTWLWDNTLTFNNTFANVHSVKVLVGSEAKSYHGGGLGGGGSALAFSDPNYWSLSNATSNITNYSYATKNTIYSLFARLDYAFNGKYLVSGTIRRDDASVLGPNVRVGTFPSVSGGWRISEESFMKGITWINDLKLRGSWGKLGSINNVSANNAFTLFGQNFQNSYYDINGTSNSLVPGYYQTQIGNPNTTWERDKIVNAGLDAELFANRLGFSIEYFQKNIDGLLFQNTLPAAGVGYATFPVVNDGNIRNRGVDMSATYHTQVSKDLSFNIGLNITSYKSMILSIPSPGYFDAGYTRLSGAFSRNEPGHPLGEFFGYKVIGLYQNADDVAKSPVEQDAAPGRFKYEDVNGDGVINDSDRTFLGNPNPKFTYGINLNASYKRFDFTMIFYGSYGNDVMNYSKYYTDFYSIFTVNKSKNALYHSWSPSNPNAKTPIQDATSYFSTSEVTNSYYMEKGSFLKCKTLMVGYTIEPALLKRAGIDRMRVYIQAANLFTITKYTGLDPELMSPGSNNNENPTYAQNASFGVDYANYPNNQRSYLVGINLSF
jgi:TonB-dependent starch-binding outer membrane protein SusC